MLTVHEFLTRLTADSSARSAFQTDPRGSLEQAGLGEMSNVDVLQAVSVVQQYAPAEGVDSLTLAVQPGVDKLTGGNQHFLMSTPLPLLVSGEEDDHMELDMTSPEIFSAAGDVDKLLASGESQQTNNVEASDSNNEMNTVASGNQVGPDSLVGDVEVTGVEGDVSGVNNSGDVNAGNVMGNGVTDVVGGATDTVAGVAGHTVHGAAGELGGVVPEPSDVTSTVGSVEPVHDVATTAGSALPEPVGGVAEQPVDTVTDTVGGATAPVEDVTGGLGL